MTGSDAVTAREIPLSRDALLWALGGLCQLHRIPFDPALVIGQFPPPYSLETLLHAAQALKFKAALKSVPIRAIPRLPLPMLALLKPAAEDAFAPALALVLRANEERLLLFDSGDPEPRIVANSDFVARYGGRVLLASPETGAPLEDGEAPARAPFGFRWFVPELLKHRGLWGEVLGISLAIQVMALAVPLFTQVIIDKVIAHQSVNTLLVIAVALAVFIAFGAALSWVRQYLVLHTGNRVDAVLGT
ncbi:MAG TPA: ABC transporter transmembrane domain-containing protein, partial [Burkholderiales bacterium]